MSAIINLAKKGRDYIFYPIRYRYTKSRRLLQTAPYPISIYDALLKNLKEKENFGFVNFTDREIRSDEKSHRFFVRHDIDTLDCIRKVPLFVERNKKHQVPAAFYFRTDGECYDLKDHAGMVHLCRENGFEAGLHTSCYTEDKYLKKFGVETDRFVTATGIQPTSFTVHGLGSYRKSVRRKFATYFPKIMGDYGYTFTDCKESIRRYDYVIEDCHLNGQQSRFIYDDFLASNPMEAGQYLILTHPCYWEN